jgi:hypothetical protein
MDWLPYIEGPFGNISGENLISGIRAIQKGRDRIFFPRIINFKKNEKIKTPDIKNIKTNIIIDGKKKILQGNLLVAQTISEYKEILKMNKKQFEEFLNIQKFNDKLFLYINAIESYINLEMKTEKIIKNVKKKKRILMPILQTKINNIQADNNEDFEIKKKIVIKNFISEILEREGPLMKNQFNNLLLMKNKMLTIFTLINKSISNKLVDIDDINELFKEKKILKGIIKPNKFIISNDVYGKLIENTKDLIKLHEEKKTMITKFYKTSFIQILNLFFEEISSDVKVLKSFTIDLTKKQKENLEFIKNYLVKNKNKDEQILKKEINKISFLPIDFLKKNWFYFLPVFGLPPFGIVSTFIILFIQKNINK